MIYQKHAKVNQCDECGKRNRDKNSHCATHGCRSKQRSRISFFKRGFKKSDFEAYWKAKELKSTHFTAFCPKCQSMQDFTTHDRRCLNFTKHTA